VEPEDERQPIREPLEGERQGNAAEGFQQGDAGNGPRQQQQREPSQAPPPPPGPFPMIGNRKACHVPGSPVLSPALPVLLSMIAALPGSIGAAHAGGEAPPSIEGRWRGEIPKSRPYRIDRVAIEIAPCGGAFCGREVNGDRSCGPVVYRLSRLPDGTLDGEMILPEGTFRVQALRDEDHLTVQVLMPGEPMSRFTRMMPIVSHFKFEGPGSCPPPVSLLPDHHPFGSISFTRPLALAKSMRPAYLARRTPTTLPMSFMEAAPVSAMAA